MAVKAKFAILVTGLLAAVIATADDRRAEANYMLHCQGCHLPGAEGSEGRVPPMNDFVGYFLHSQAGREFLIRVPGVAHAALSDGEVTELMNWLLRRFSLAQLPKQFEPFTVAEVSRLRRDVEQAPDATRIRILAKISADNPSLEIELADNNN